METEHLTSWERTAHWVESYTAESAGLVSPSIPPSILSDVSFCAPSETESSRSVPPRMVLRYGDGRPDIPIPVEDTGARIRRKTNTSKSSTTSRGTSPTLIPPLSYSSSNHRRERSSSQRSSPPTHTFRPRSPLAPEEIRVLPSRQYTSNSLPGRSKSVPRNTTSPSVPRPFPTSYSSMTTSEPPHTWHPYIRERSHYPQKQPHAMSFAPFYSNVRDHENPPVSHYYHTHDPRGAVFNHCVPFQNSVGRYHDDSMLDQPSRSLAGKRRVDTLENRKPPLPLLTSLNQSSSTSLDSHESYHVLPSAGRKLHVIPASPDSATTPTSTTRSSASPQLSELRKAPFFRRLLSFAGRYTSPSRKSQTVSRKNTSINGQEYLQKYHSTSGSARGGQVYQY